MRNRSPQTAVTPFDSTEQTPPPERGTRGVPADVLTAMAVRPDNAALSSPLDIDALLDMEIEGWKPADGDKVIGTVVNVEVAGQQSEFGAYPLLTIRREPEGSLVNVHAFHTVLRRELGKRQIGMGDRIGIKYLGIKSDGAGLPYENYRVVCEPATAAHVAEGWARS